MLNSDDIHNKFIKDWLDYCGNSESPLIFNMWSGISTLAACLDRDNSLQVGRFNHFSNMYIFLVGPAAVRKSSAASLGKKLLEKYTNCKFGPTDTAGKKQGLLSSFYNAYGQSAKNEELADEISDMITDPEITNNPVADAFAKHRAAKAKAPKSRSYDYDNVTSRSLFIFADELATLIGLNQIEMINFLTEIYYCPADYQYTLSKETRDIDYPYLNLLGCITPTSLAAHLPPQSVGQGFTSRAIMVYEGVARPKVFPAPELDKKLEAVVGEALNKAFNFIGEFSMADQTVEIMTKLYFGYTSKINDSRFQHYDQRRQDHLIKLCMVLAAGENRDEVLPRDVADAQVILEATEINMAASLGEIGLDKITIAKQHMREMITSSWPLGVSVSVLRSNMLRDMQVREFEAALNAFCTNGLCKLATKQHEGQKIDIVMPTLSDEVKERNKIHGKFDKSFSKNRVREQKGKAATLLGKFME